MPTTRMGFEGQLFIGTAGSTAATQVLNATDITETYGNEKGNTTVRGAGTSVPIQTEDVSLLTFQLEWTMIYDTDDSVLTTIMGHAVAGTGFAVRTKDYSSGAGFDGDGTVTVTKGKPLNGEQTRQFTFTPSRGYGRAPVLST